MESAGQIIKRLREERGQTLEDVALAVGLTFGAVSQWENGRTHPRRAVAFKLDDFLQADGAIIAALGYARPTTGPSDAAARLAELERRVEVLGKRLAALSTTQTQLVRMSHQHGGRRRAEATASDRSVGA